MEMLPHCVIFDKKMYFQGIIIFMLTLFFYAHAQSNDCAMGYYGPACRNPCNINCLSIECNSDTGECKGGCKNGYVGSICNETCPSGFYGNKCTFKCPANCEGNACNHVTGACNSTCLTGYTGEQCNQACNRGFYGDGCQTSCPVNCAENECNHKTGYCLKGCKPNFWGSDCSLSGEFQQNSEPSKQKFYTQLSAESRSVLLYILMGEYEKTLESAQMEIKRGIYQRNQLRDLMGGDF